MHIGRHLTFVMSLVAASIAPLAADAWTEFAPAGDGFRVLVIGTPDPERVEAGSVWAKRYAFFSNGVRFTAAYSELPAPIDPQRLARALEEARDGIVNDALGRLRSDNPVTVSGHAARQISIALDDGRVIVSRIVIDGDLLFQAAAETSADNKGAPEIARFLDSFSIDP